MIFWLKQIQCKCDTFFTVCRIYILIIFCSTTSQSLKTEIFNSPNELQGDAQPVVENNSLNHLEESSFVEKQQIVHSLNEKPSVDLSGGKVSFGTASSTVPSTSQTNSIRVTCSWADCTYQAVGKLQLMEHISSVHI